MALPKSREFPHQCVFCDKTFRFVDYLKDHLLAHSQESPFHCRFCKLEFRYKTSLIAHLAKVHFKEAKLSVNGNRCKNPDHIKSTFEKFCRNTCVFCNKRYVHDAAFESHIRTHTGERPYHCTRCYRAFTNIILLRRHDRRLHAKYQTLYQCELCSKNYTGESASAMNAHFDMHHRGKPVSYQRTKIKRKSTMQNNQRRQVNVGPLECQECEKRFYTKSNVKKHYKLYHPDRKFALKIVDPDLNTIMQTRHKCIFCAKGFPHFRDLNQHLMTKIGERPYFCRVCGRELKEKTYLRDHLYKTHKILPKAIKNPTKKSEKPELYNNLSCVFCPNFFTQRGLLEGHIRTHIDERPFHCPYCSKGLTSERSLKKHTRIFHPDGRKSKSIAKINKSPIDGNISNDYKSGEASTSQNSNPNGQTTAFDIENCRAGSCKWCKVAVESLPLRRYTFICPDPDPTGKDPVRCGRKFQCLYQLALHFRDDHRIPIFQNM